MPGRLDHRNLSRISVSIASVLFVLAFTSGASAQLLAAKDGPIVYGHHHVNATNLDEHKKFWVDTLGGTAITIGSNNQEIIRFPNVLVFLRAQAPTGGSKGTTADHIGFSMPDIRQTIAKVRANGFRMVTREEVAPNLEVKDDIVAGRNISIAHVMGPDNTKVELVEIKDQKVPVMLNHLHFFGPQNLDMQAWYVKVFGAKARNGGAFPVAELPGLAMNFSPSDTPVVGTQGRAVDHIGFEVRNLEEFCKTLEAQGIKLSVAYRKVPALNIAIAFITDPWGTYIELTEGLDRVP